MESMPNRSYHILLVEDNQGDTLLIRKALKDSRFNSHVHVVPEGNEAISFLRGRDKHVSVPVPDLIILDLLLPGKDGYEVLEEIKSDRRLRTIPVVVFTGSGAPEDVKKAYELGANCYVVKPVGFEELQRLLAAVQGFWFGVAKLPTVE